MLIWTTDIHLNFLKHWHAGNFGRRVAEAYPEADTMVVTGDIAESKSIVRLLTEFQEGLGKKILFLLGNHDYYGDSIDNTHAKIAALNNPNLVWLDQTEPLVFEDFALVGAYAWYDGLNGVPQKTPIILHDFDSVAEFRRIFNEVEWMLLARSGSRNPLLKTLRTYAKESVNKLRPKLEQALQLKNNVIVATHVAPFEGAAWHQGKISNPDWQPWFSCQHMGDMLLEVAEAHPDRKILVLCGHSHSPGVYRPMENLLVLTGESEYRDPRVSGIIDASSFENWPEVKP